MLSSKLPVSCKCDPLGRAATPSSSYLTKAFERRLSRGKAYFVGDIAQQLELSLLWTFVSVLGKRNILVNCVFFLFCDSLKPNSFFLAPLRSFVVQFLSDMGLTNS